MGRIVLVTFADRSWFRLTVLLSVIKHWAVTFVFFPLAAEDLDERFLLVETGFFFEDGLIFVLTETYILLVLLTDSISFFSRYSRSVVRDILGDVLFTFEKVQDSVFMLFQHINVHEVELATAHHSSTGSFLFLLFSSTCLRSSAKFVLLEELTFVPLVLLSLLLQSLAYLKVTPLPRVSISLTPELDREGVNIL